LCVSRGRGEGIGEEKVHRYSAPGLPTEGREHRRVGEAEACAAMEAAADAESSRRSDADPWRRACGGGRSGAAEAGGEGVSWM